MFAKTILVMLTPMLISTPTFAQSKTEVDEKIEALKVLRKYSETVSCESSFEKEKSAQKLLKNVYTIDFDPEMGFSTFFILWDGDVGCNGGTGTHSFIISEVSRYSNSRPILVQNNDAFGEDVSKNINQRFIEKIQQINRNKFIIMSSDFADDDSNNFPSKKYQYTVDLINYKWKVTNKKYIGKKTY